MRARRERRAPRRSGPLYLSDTEKDDLLGFLESLTGSNVGVLAAAAAVGDPG